MRQKYIFLVCFKESLSLLRSHKVLVLAIFVMQLIFFSMLFFVLLAYSTKIGQSAAAIMEYVEKQDVDEASVYTKLLKKEEVLSEDPIIVFNEFKKITSSLLYLSLYSSLAFVLFNGLNWALTDNLINKKKLKGFFSYLVKFAIVSAIYFLIIFLISRAVLSKLSLEEFQLNNLYPLLLLLAIFYLMFISIPLVGRNNLKDIAKKTFTLGIKKAHIVVLAYIANLIIISIPTAMMVYFSELSFVLLFIAFLLFILSFVYVRLFLILVVDTIASQ